MISSARPIAPTPLTHSDYPRTYFTRVATLSDQGRRVGDIVVLGGKAQSFSSISDATSAVRLAQSEMYRGPFAIMSNPATGDPFTIAPAYLLPKNAASVEREWPLNGYMREGKVRPVPGDRNYLVALMDETHVVDLPGDDVKVPTYG